MVAMGRPIECTCAGCVSRRLAQQRWEKKNRKKRLAINRASQARQRVRLKTSQAEVSDEEMDRRAMLIKL